MAASPQYKIYDRFGEYQAAVKEIEAAACLMGLYGDGATIRLNHRLVLWTEGAEGQSAGESYDTVAMVAAGRRADNSARHLTQQAAARAMPV